MSGVDGTTIMAGVAAISIAWVLHRVAHKPPADFRRETRAVPLGYSGTQRLQEAYPGGCKIPYRAGTHDWESRGLDIYGGYYGVS